MIFPIYLDLIFVGLLLLWYALYVVTKFAVAVESKSLEWHDKHSVTEHILDRAELAFENAVIGTSRLIRFVALGVLTKIIPIFRNLTSGIESGLVNLVGTLRGQHDRTNMNRANRSDFVKDIKSHASESRKTGGAIHEDGAAH